MVLDHPRYIVHQLRIPESLLRNSRIVFEKVWVSNKGLMGFFKQRLQLWFSCVDLQRMLDILCHEHNQTALHIVE